MSSQVLLRCRSITWQTLHIFLYAKYLATTGKPVTSASITLQVLGGGFLCFFICSGCRWTNLTHDSRKWLVYLTCSVCGDSMSTETAPAPQPQRVRTYFCSCVTYISHSRSLDSSDMDSVVKLLYVNMERIILPFMWSPLTGTGASYRLRPSIPMCQHVNQL